jgi:sugar-specific transcriptional regulator TrmB
MLLQELNKLGLNEKEAKAYLALLELGEASIQQISKKSGIKRTTVYDIIESLRQKGLLSSISKNKKTLFFAENPAKIEESLDEKKNVLRKILPELLSITNLMEKKPKIRYFEGIEGIKDVYRDTLNYPDQELLAWVSEEAVIAFDEEFLNDYYLPKRINKKIWVRAIAPDKDYMQKYKGLDEKSLRKTKLVSMEKFPIEVEINLYGKHKIGIMLFSEKIGLIIESKKIYNTLKSVFEMNWQSVP